MANLWIIFLTGLLTGGLTCAAVQGGLLATTIAQRQGVDTRSGQMLPILSFLVAKLIAYVILGFFLGWLGSFFQLTITMQVMLLVVVSIFMIGTALNFLNVHPIFRYFILTPPKFLTRIIRNQSKSSDVFAPMLLGTLTIFLPCGTTQAMMALAIASRVPLYGALIMGTFVLGTSPLFFFVGYSVAKLKDVFQEKFYRAAAYAIFGMALWNINGAVALSGSDWTMQAVLARINCAISFCDTPRVLSATSASDEVNVTIQSSGYTIDHSVIKAGAPITLRLYNQSGQGCTQVFTVPTLGIQKVVPIGQSATVQFTAPSEPGELAYTCSMGMYGGKFYVQKG